MLTKEKSNKIRIGILGIGAVGGYFGGLLADKYEDSNEVEVIFIARPSSEKVIKEKGLQLATSAGEKTVHPTLVTSEAYNIPLLDLLICAVKSYDLEDSLKPLGDCITAETTILPLLNGVDASERIKAICPNSQVLEGCCYLMCRLV